MIVIDKIDGKECVVILEPASSDEAGMTFNRVLTLTPANEENIWDDLVTLRMFGLEVTIHAGELEKAVKQAEVLGGKKRNEVLQKMAML
jgi:hypothetical protein